MRQRSIDRGMLLVNLSMLLVAVCWGANFVAMKHLIEQVGSIEVLLIRVYFAAAVFALFVLIRRRSIPRFSGREWRILTLVGFFGVVTNQLFMTVGADYLSAALASLLVTSAPIFMAILSRVFLKERLTARKLAGIAIAFAGFLIVMLLGGPNSEFSVNNVVGVLVILLGPLSWTTSTLISKPLMLAHDPKMITALSTVVGGLILIPALITQPELASDVLSFNGVSWLAAFTTSVLAVVVAYTLWYQGLRRLEPTQIAIYIYLVPFFGVLFAWLLRGEAITIFLVFGGLTILSGVIVTNSSRRSTAAPTATRPHTARSADAQPIATGEEFISGK